MTRASTPAGVGHASGRCRRWDSANERNPPVWNRRASCRRRRRLQLSSGSDSLFAAPGISL